MKLKLFLILCVFAITAVSAFAQTRTVTNFELDKYKQQRLQAEKDLRENYSKMGFPSPEELERQREATKKENAELAERFARERVEQENAAELERQVAAYNAQQRYYQSSNQVFPVYDNGLFYSTGYRRNFRGRQQQTQTGYFAGGAFWPQPDPNRRPTPIFIRPEPRRPRH